MKSVAWAEQFLVRFGLPLCQGGVVHVGEPLLRRGAQLLLDGVSAGLDGTPAAEALAEARQQRLLALLPDAVVPRLDEDPSALLLLVALHDLLFLQHPAKSRLSERQTALLVGFALRLCDKARAQLPDVAPALLGTDAGSELPIGSAPPQTLAAATQKLLGRYSLLAGLSGLWRADPPVSASRPSRLRGLLGGAAQPEAPTQKLRVLGELAALPRAELAVQALLAASPLTALLPPPESGQLPDLAAHAAWLRLPVVARLVVARYLAPGAVSAVAEAGAAVCAILQRQPLAEQQDRAHALSKSDLMTLLCLVAHLHVCAALGDRAPPAAEAATAGRDSYALYAAVTARWPLLSAPQDVLGDPALSGRLLNYVRACRAAAGAARVRELDELCVQALAAKKVQPGPHDAASG